MGTRLEGQRILVTGASSGIGRDLARQLAGRGARLAITARRRELLDALADDIEQQGRPRPAVLVADLLERGAAAGLAAEAQDALGAVDILVNNAGGGVGGTQWRVGDTDAAREAFELNFWSPLALTSALVPGCEAATRRVPMGDPAKLAKLVVRAIERGKKRVVYPRPLGLGYHFPTLARASTGAVARRNLDPALRSDERVLRSGSFGDEEARQARADWERRHAGAG